MTSNAIETQGTYLGIQSATETVDVTFDAVGGTIDRAAGDFTTNFSVGMIVFTNDPDNPGPFIVTGLTATEMTVSGVLTTDAVAASFTLTGYLEIGEVTDFSGPGGAAAVIDRTHLQSVAKEKLMGLPDEGQFTFSLNFVPGNAGQIAFRTARKTRVETNFVIVFSDGTASTNATNAKFAGFALEFAVSGGVEAKVGGTATIEITGAVAWSDET